MHLGNLLFTQRNIPNSLLVHTPICRTEEPTESHIRTRQARVGTGIACRTATPPLIQPANAGNRDCRRRQ
ncbi:hypothetical protein SAMN06265222_101209 [Neorhodopirellula lusitana]|uniref:Uncharacterized protein n=1 Tax=Neorhodopirellula lusitana TaxID=445327 RepID=A0ABY1PR15_9BACT|nr:hypothetical protein SAMN06265222_101209 [Neorhodopirellula lusitana]